jgi:hypothetical protein
MRHFSQCKTPALATNAIAVMSTPGYGAVRNPAKVLDAQDSPPPRKSPHPVQVCDQGTAKPVTAAEPEDWRHFVEKLTEARTIGPGHGPTVSAPLNVDANQRPAPLLQTRQMTPLKSACHLQLDVARCNPDVSAEEEI